MPSILLVDDDPSSIQVMRRILVNEGSVRFATNGRDALRLAEEIPPDIILLDAEMPGMNGFELCVALKSQAALEDVPIMFVTSHRDEPFELAGFEVGGVDFITKPVNPQLMVVRVRSQLRVKRMADELRRTATTDSLTGIANRRLFDSTLRHEWLRARRSQSSLGLVLVDIDHFKAFNDHYGHPVGDECLRAVARAIGVACRRPADLVARYGGEEFALVLPDTPIIGAEHIARLILDAVESLRVPHEKSPVAPHVTVSAGVACFHDTDSSRASADSFSTEMALQQMIQAADTALYSAKRAGRARACVLHAKECARGGVLGELETTQLVASSRRPL